ncbi:hypothetical protein PC128_g10833 [Phytophthora cactorum]|nr:hypothetical protein PC120_g24543 [Phytophthora cactorum]KAG3069471.1 hypothetical protein PC121_g9811 [Phytophthora cactorum]KAG3191648.1 hypothetical protein PC128_g10833 [Phytophthora cactorum]KAG4039645.1 hypothetical protein PC123_g24807 [Phytophthora cactorum]
MTDWRAMTDAMEATTDAPMPLAGQYEWDTLAELQPEGHTNWCVEKERGEERVKNNGSNNSERVNKQDEGVKSNDIDKLKYEEPAQRDAVQMIAYSEDLHV